MYMYMINARELISGKVTRLLLISILRIQHHNKRLESRAYVYNKLVFTLVLSSDVVVDRVAMHTEQAKMPYTYAAAIGVGRCWQRGPCPPWPENSFI